MSSTTRSVPQVRIGDWVSFLYGPRKARAQVVEDRGQLGVGGRRLYRVRLDADQSESSAFELPEEDLAAAEPPDDWNPLLQITLDYISQGKRFDRISPEPYAKSHRKVVFHFSDGTKEKRTFQCDHSTFMKWWRATSSYLRLMADAFASSGGQ